MTDRKTPQQGSENQGEGNRTAAREYNEAQRTFVEEGRVEGSARKAAEAVESVEERERLEEAERQGKSKAKEFDPNVKRDY
jgi:hypothetical protein